MNGGTAEFTSTRVGSGARFPIVIVPLFLVAVIGLSVFGGPAQSSPVTAPFAAAPYVAAPMGVSTPVASGIPLLTWSVPHPNEIRVRAHRLMRLGRLSDPYER
jgi:hypothetical protein